MVDDVNAENGHVHKCIAALSTNIYQNIAGTSHWKAEAEALPAKFHYMLSTKGNTAVLQVTYSYVLTNELLIRNSAIFLKPLVQKRNRLFRKCISCATPTKWYYNRKWWIFGSACKTSISARTWGYMIKLGLDDIFLLLRYLARSIRSSELIINCFLARHILLPTYPVFYLYAS